jgi:hypothetical protein
MGISQLRIADGGLRIEWRLPIEYCALRLGIGRGENIKTPFHPFAPSGMTTSPIRAPNARYSIHFAVALRAEAGAIHADNQEW